MMTCWKIVPFVVGTLRQSEQLTKFKSCKKVPRQAGCRLRRRDTSFIIFHAQEERLLSNFDMMEIPSFWLAIPGKLSSSTWLLKIFGCEMSQLDEKLIFSFLLLFLGYRYEDRAWYRKSYQDITSSGLQIWSANAKPLNGPTPDGWHTSGMGLDRK